MSPRRFLLCLSVATFGLLATTSGQPAPNADTATRKRLNPTTTETTFTKGGKVTSVNTSVVAADGKTMTITAKGTTAQGQPMLNVQVYEKK